MPIGRISLAVMALAALAAWNAPAATPAGNPPQADSQTVNFPTADVWPKALITLTGSDDDGSTLTARIVTLPSVGSLYQTPDGTQVGSQITGPTTLSNMLVLYAPLPNGSGSPYDTFGFIVNDGASDSVAATVTVNVISKAESFPPVGFFSPTTISTAENVPVQFQMQGGSPQGLPVTFLVNGYTNGTVSDPGNGPNATYTPNTNFYGTESLSFSVADVYGQGSLSINTLTITVNPGPVILINAGNNQTVHTNSTVPIPPSVIVQDGQGNPMSGVAVTFTVTGGEGSISGTTTTTNSSGIATVGSWTMGPTLVTNTLTAAANGIPGSAVFTATVVAGAPGPPAHIVLNAGGGQSATVNTAVATPPSFLVEDQYYAPISGLTVTFAASNGGSVSPTSVTTDGSGRATVTTWILGTTAGTNTLSARISGTSLATSVTATGIAGAAASIALGNTPSTGATVNTSVVTPPTFVVKDLYNNVIPGALVTFFADNGGSVSPAFIPTNASGIAIVSTWTLGQSVGTNTLSASISGTGIATQVKATGTSGAPASIALSNTPGASATVNTALGTPPAFVVKDQYNNAVPGVLVTFTVTQGSVAPTSVTTDAGGIAYVATWTLGTTVGTNTLTATATGVTTPATAAALGTAGAAAQITLNSGAGQNAVVGQPVPTAPTFIVKDSNNNVVPGALVTFTVTQGSVTPASVTTDAGGIANVATWTLGTTAGTNTLSATVAGVTTPGTVTAIGTAGVAAQIGLNSGGGQNAVVGQAVATAPTFIVEDANNNALAGVLVTFTVTQGSVTPASVTTDAGGIAQVATWTLGTTAGTNTLTATAAGVTTPATATATGTAGAASQIALNSGGGQNAVAGQGVPIAPTFVVKDTNNNVVPGALVTFSVTQGSVTPASVTTDAGGIAHVATWTLGTAAGTNTLTATAAGVTTPATVTATGTAGAAAQIALNSGEGQDAVAGQSVATAPTFIVRDTNNNVVAGVLVTFTVTQGSVAPASVTTDAGGIASVSTWTLGITAGTNTLTAVAAGVTTPATVTATGTAGPPTLIALNSGGGQNAVAGQGVPIAPTFVVKDTNNNVVPGILVTFTVTQGSVMPASVTTDAGGIAHVATWTLGTTAGTNTLTATAVGVTTPATVTAAGTAGAAAQIALNSGGGQNAVAGQSVAAAPTFIVKDTNNNVVPGTLVTFTITQGSVTPASVTTDAGGIAQVATWTLGTTAGTNTLTATAAGVATPATVTAIGTAGAAAQIALNSGGGQNAVAGQAVAVAPTFIVKDSNSNVVAGVLVTFTVTQGSMTPTSVTTDAGGIAHVATWTLGTTAGTNTLTATAAGVATPATVTATGTPGVVAQIALDSGSGQNAVAGQSVTTAPTFIVKDTNNNVVPGALVTFTITQGSVTPASVTTDAGGVAQVATWTLGTTAGTNTLTATAAGVATPATVTAIGTAGAAAQIALNSGSGQNAVAGQAVATAPTFIVKDANSNVVAGVLVTFTITQGSVTPASVTTDAGGIAQVATWTLGTTAGTNTLTATAAGVTTPATVTATGTAGAASQIALNSGAGQNAVAGQSVTTAPTFIVKDTNNNVVPGALVTFTITQGSVTPASVTTDAGGIAQVATWTLGTTAGTNTLTATTAGVTTPATVTAIGTAGPAANLALNAGNLQSASVNTSVAIPPSVLVTDAHGNPVSGVSVTFSVTVAANGGHAAGLYQVTNSSGIATVGSWTLGTTSGVSNNTLQAAAAGLAPVSFTATGIAAPAIVVHNAPSTSGTAGAPLAIPPAFLVTDATSTPMVGLLVTFTVDHGGSVEPASVTTDGNGVATVSTWTLGQLVGTNTITAAASGIPGPAIFTVAANPGAPASISLSNLPSTNAAVATAVAAPPAFVVKDQYNNVVAGVTVTFAADHGGSVTPASATTNAGGIVSVSTWTLGTAAGTNTLWVSINGSAQSTSVLATGMPGAPVQIALNSGGGQSATVATAVSVPPVFVVEDQYNNVVAGVTVTFAADHGGSVTPASATTNAGGAVTINTWTLGTTTGANKLWAGISGSAPSTSVSATGMAGAPAQIALVSGGGQSAIVAAAVSVPPAFVVKDLYDNVVAGVTVTFAADHGGSVTPASAATNIGGLVSVSIWTLGQTLGANTLSAAVGGTTVSIQVAATGTKPATPPTLANIPADLTVNATGAQTAVTFSAPTATDLFGNAVPVTCVPASGSAFAVGPTTVHCGATDSYGNTASGSFTVTVRVTTAPVLTLPASVTADATSPDGAVVTFAPAAVDLLGNAVPVTCAPVSGSTFAVGTTTVQCSATDAYGNPVSGSFTVTVMASVPAITSMQVSAAVVAGQQAYANAAASLSHGGGAAFSWDFGDGTAPVAGANVAHVYAAAGVYTVTLTVTADDGFAATQSATVQVGMPAKTLSGHPVLPPDLAGQPVAASNGKATLALMAAKPLGSSFKAEIEGITLPAGVKQTALTGKTAALTLAGGQTPYTCTLDKNGSGHSGGLSAFKLSVKQGTLNFTISKDAGLNGLIQALASFAYTPPVKGVKPAPFTLYVPAVIDIDGNTYPLVVTFILSCKQTGATVKGSAAKY